MQIKLEKISDIIVEETVKVLEAENPGFFKGLKTAFMKGYRGEQEREDAAAPASKPASKPAGKQKPKGELAWGPEGYQDVEWSPSEPQVLAPTPDKPKLGPSIEKTAKEAGIKDSELLQQLISKLKGVEVVSDDRPTLTLKQLKDMMTNIGVDDPADPETGGVADEFINKVIDQGRLHERISEILAEQDKPLEQLIQRAKSRSGRCNKQGFVGFGAEKLSDKHSKFISQLQEKLRSEGTLSEGDPEGVFGQNTLEAVVEAQQAAGTKPDGCVGPKTAKAFNIVDEYDEMTVVSRGETEAGSYKIEKITGQVAQGRVNGKRAVFLPNEVRIGGTLAWRNNNPGNIRLTRYWKNWGALGRAFGFATFETAEDGFDALKKYIDKYGFKREKYTIASFMQMYAPRQDSNDPKSYAAKIARSLNASVDDKMSNFADDDTALDLFAKAIRRVEGWKSGIVSRDLALSNIASDAIAEGKNND